MIIRTLGCGSEFFSKAGNTSFLISSGKTNLLIGCGWTVPKELHEAGAFEQVTHCFVGQARGDTIGGLEECAKRWYNLGLRPYLLLPPGIRDGIWQNYLSFTLRSLGRLQGKEVLATLVTYFRPYACAVGKWIDIGPFLLAVYLTQPKGLRPTYAILVQEKGGKQALFTSLSGTCAGLPYQAADLIFHDCSLAGAEERTKVEDLLQFPAEIQQKFRLTNCENLQLRLKGALLEEDLAPLRFAKLGDKCEL